MLEDLMHQAQENNSVGEYHFFDGDIDDFQQEFSAPKQDMGIDMTPDDVPKAPERTADEERQITDSAQKTAKFITSVGDTIFANSLAWIDHSGDAEPHRRINDPLMRDLENAITYYCERVGGEIPPSVMIIICICMLYGVQVPQALKDRKAYERAEKQRESEECAYYYKTQTKHDEYVSTQTGNSNSNSDGQAESDEQPNEQPADAD